MSERIAAAVWVKPRRRLAFCSAVAAVLLAVVVIVGVMSTSSSAAPAKRRPHQAGAGNSGLSQGQINSRVTALINQMSPQEKFGQLTMAGPATPTGSDLIPLAEK
jgi:hypothetical protein